MAATTINPLDHAKASSRRRTRRVSLSVQIEVFGSNAQGDHFSIRSNATNLNQHGAKLQLTRDLPLDSILVLKNSHGTRTSVRVVALRAVSENQFEYGVEFVEAEKAKDFWGINFPARSR
jgi:hypothetical protein